MKFFYYDLTNYAQSRQYFNKLMEYQINYKEWETIIKKINLKESGLSDLFADCKDEKGLTEKWFLEAIESKLNKDKTALKSSSLFWKNMQDSIRITVPKLSEETQSVSLRKKQMGFRLRQKSIRMRRQRKENSRIKLPGLSMM